MRLRKIISIPILILWYIGLVAQCPSIAIETSQIDTFCSGTRYSFGDTIILNEGLYRNAFVDVNGCDSIVSLDLRETPNVSFELEVDTIAPVCTSDSLGAIVIRAVGKGVEPIVYSLNNGPEQRSNVFNDLPPGSYQLYLRDRFGCEARTFIPLRLNPIFGENLIDTLCAGSTYFFGNQRLIEAGMYTDTLIGAKGCDSLIRLDLRVEALDNMLSFNPSAVQPGCNGELTGSILIDDISGTDPPFKVYFEDQLQTGNSIDGLDPGEYTVTAYDRNFCAEVSVISIIEPEFAFELDVGEDDIIDLGETVFIVIESNVDLQSFMWNNPPDPNCLDCTEIEVMPIESTDYILEATNIDGCTQSDTLSIVVLNEAVVYIPNAFSPTSANIDNQVFSVIGNSAAILSLRDFIIYDKWGNEVFSNPNPIINDVSTGWDGTLNEEFVEAGVYAYTLIVTLINNTEERITGTVHLF